MAKPSRHQFEKVVDRLSSTLPKPRTESKVKVMLEPGKRKALETIIAQSEVLRDLAKRSGNGFLAYLLENALREAWATLIGAGRELLSHAPSGEERSPRSVAPLVQPDKPRR